MCPVIGQKNSFCPLFGIQTPVLPKQQTDDLREKSKQSMPTVCSNMRILKKLFAFFWGSEHPEEPAHSHLVALSELLVQDFRMVAHIRRHKQVVRKAILEQYIAKQTANQTWKRRMFLLIAAMCLSLFPSRSYKARVQQVKLNQIRRGWKKAVRAFSPAEFRATFNLTRGQVHEILYRRGVARKLRTSNKKKKMSPEETMHAFLFLLKEGVTLDCLALQVRRIELHLWGVWLLCRRACSWGSFVVSYKVCSQGVLAGGA